MKSNPLSFYFESEIWESIFSKTCLSLEPCRPPPELTGKETTMDARFQRLLNNMGSGGSGMGSVPADSPQVDTSEQLYISSLALLKMLKHGEDFHWVCIDYRLW